LCQVCANAIAGTEGLFVGRDPESEGAPLTFRRPQGDRIRPRSRSGDSGYIVELIGRVVRVSVETVKIVKELPNYR